MPIVSLYKDVVPAWFGLIGFIVTSTLLHRVVRYGVLSVHVLKVGLIDRWHGGPAALT